MTDSSAPSTPAIVTHSDNAKPLWCLTNETLPAWLATQPAQIKQWLDAQAFTATPGSALLLPDANGVSGAILGIGDAHDPYSYAHGPLALPVADWAPQGDFDEASRAALQLGWSLGAYRFDRYKAPLRAPARLLLADPDAVLSDVFAACCRVRDMVHTPSEHMGPDEIEAIAREIAAAQGARIDVKRGDELIAGNYPAIHAVGRASHRAPRIIELEWGDASAPHLAIVGKGVCFDTGGLNLKAGAGMRNMKKDMGGAAHAIALAELLMRRKVPLHITLLVPAVENAVGPNALRPGEIIATRKGASVEIDNTDAEGRLVLADALTRAAELQPALIVDFATLTGAARVALGPDLPALYANDDAVAQAWLQSGNEQRDPLWRMPLWQPYLRYLVSGIADIANASSTTMAGSVTAALFLQKFVPAEQRWAHVDVYSWNDSDRPGRPAGGEAQGLRAAFAMLKNAKIVSQLS
ncbi:leucyl aminopeptidase family protein [Solilutibacter silvestris]|uniref:Leucyl aminopeptidase n=1 Tax=Solilutibacter silvestris TaxID=1645665 RepID=A0A2K1Q246_9GAMM|nr:leucyl aminopeptidase family protein [Lysobacter silvestris]PNS09128.1 Leucyl aminopeptidase [Lysobacter silvestris]